MKKLIYVCLFIAFSHVLIAQDEGNTKPVRKGWGIGNTIYYDGYVTIKISFDFAYSNEDNKRGRASSYYRIEQVSNEEYSFDLDFDYIDYDGKESHEHSFYLFHKGDPEIESNVSGNFFFADTKYSIKNLHISCNKGGQIINKPCFTEREEKAREMENAKKRQQDSLANLKSKTKELIQQGDAAIKTGNYNAAQNYYNEAAATDPTNTYAKNQLEKARTLSEKKEAAANAPKSITNSFVDKGVNRSSSETNTYQEQSAFEAQKKRALDEQAKYDEANRQAIGALGSLAAIWIGAYVFNEPRCHTYNTKGAFFSLAPTNSFISAPVYSSNYDKTIEINSSSTNTNVTEKYNGAAQTVNAINFGLKTETGYLSDAIHFTVPVQGNFGFLTNSQLHFNVGGGANLFFGSKNWKKFKLGLCYQYNYHSMDRHYKSTTSIADYYLAKKFEDADASFGLSTLKFGFRKQSHFNTQEINLKEPFVIDLLFTLNFVNELQANRGYNSLAQPVAPGFELNISKYGIFGFFVKFISMAPVGNLQNYLPPGNQVGDKASPYIEIGIKREYSWFKKHK